MIKVSFNTVGIFLVLEFYIVLNRNLGGFIMSGYSVHSNLMNATIISLNSNQITFFN
jgi:hypothetical protein